MKKLFFAVIILSTLSLTSQAQSVLSMLPIDFGVKAGVNINNIDVDDVESSVLDVDSHAGYHLGVQARVTLGPIFVQPELLYSRSKAEYSFSGETTDVTSNSIDLPVMVGLKFGPARVGGGLSFALMDDISADDISDVSIAKESVSSYLIGVGVDLFSFTLDARYVKSLGSAAQTLLGTTVAEVKSSYYQISVGYMF